MQSAEYSLVAANARIGVAKAAYFPQIVLTGSGGYQSSALTKPFLRACRLLERRRPAGTTHLYRRKNSFRREIV